MVIRCIVRYRGHAVDVRVSPRDTVANVIVQAASDLKIVSADDDPSLHLHSQRLSIDLPYDAIATQYIDEGDTLELAESTGGSHASSHRRLHSKSSVQRLPRLHHRSVRHVTEIQATHDEAMPQGLIGCRPGVFVLSPIKAEHLVASSRFRASRASLRVRLHPYEDQTHDTSTATGPEYVWSTSMRFRHSDQNRSGLVFVVNVYEEPSLSTKALVGRAYVTLEDALDTPGVNVIKWIRVDRIAGVDETDHTHTSRILFSLCFHPQVSKGPTVQSYLHAIAHSEDDSSGGSHNGGHRRHHSNKRSFLQTVFGGSQRRKKDFVLGQATSLDRQQSLRRNKGLLSFSLHGIHLCGDQCSNIDGHSAVSLPDFTPIVVIRYDTFEEELRVSPTECAAVRFDHEWPVYSSFANIELEIYRRAGFATGSASRKLRSDGGSAIKIGSLSVSCFDILERRAASFTLDPLPTELGPGRHPPLPGCQWYSLLEDDEEIGLAQVSASYSEDLLAIMDTEESSDLSFIPFDERTFDPAVVQRNFERLDELYTLVKEMSGFWDDTLDWKSLIRTICTWAAINLVIFCIPGDHLPVFAILFLLVLLSFTFISFRKGNTHKRWIEQTPTTSRLKIFRPVATLRVAPLSASHLSSSDGHDSSPDSFVRMFYEPNFKKVPVRQLAQTECARRTKNPDWSRPQRDSLTPDTFLRANNNRFKDLVKHLTPFAQDAVLHDVVEPWAKAEGGTDAHAFRFSLLQPVRTDSSNGEDILIEWHRAPGVLRFDVIQDTSGGESTALIGRVRLPIRSLVSDESTGGPQEEFTLQLPLAQPPRHSAAESSSEHRHAHHSTATLTVRVQLILRNPDDRITLSDTLASEALYEATELEAERELSWVEKYHKAKDVAKNIQQALGSICSTLERFKNLFLWVHPQKTVIMYVGLLAGAVWFYFVPMKYMVFYASTKAFTRRFHKVIDKDLVRFKNLLITIPTDLDMKKMYSRKNQEFLAAKDHTEAQAKLKAVWSGNVQCQRFSWLQSWHERYCAIRGGRLELWQSIADAKAGLPPKQSFPVANIVDTCTKSESEDTPRDCYPVVVVDVTRSILTTSPRGKRRIFCFSSEDSLRGFTDAVRTTGEPFRSHADATERR